jgi:hypothetical protein
MSRVISSSLNSADRATEILYLHPAKHAAEFSGYVQAKSASPYMLLPVGVPGLINLLREHGFQVIGLNVPLETMLDQRFDLATWIRGQPGVRLGAIDLHWYEHAFGALDVALICKQVLPEVPVVLGGLTASYYANQILGAFPQVDAVILETESGLC